MKFVESIMKYKAKFRFQYERKNVSENWLGGEDSLGGFVWRGGSTRVTTGIHMWGDIFLHDYDDGRKVAIILIDTQGTFDSKTTMQDCLTIFALSTLLSSVQIFNLMQNIQEDDLQHLQLFSEYGRMAAKDGEKPFQKLMFLVRDWQYPYEHKYGSEGGQELLDERFGLHEDQHMEHRSLRTHLNTCYDEIRCFLMPSPGSKVATSQDFVGKLNDIDEDFKENLKLLIPLVASPENLVVKKVNGQAVKAHEWVEFFKTYFGVFESGELPTVRTIFEATAFTHNKNAVKEGKNHYDKNMRTFCGTFTAQDEDVMRQEHARRKAEAFDVFNAKQPMGGQDYLTTFIRMLDEFIETTLLELIKKNKGKFNSTKIILGLLSLMPVVGTAMKVPAVVTYSATLFGYLLNFVRRRPALN